MALPCNYENLRQSPRPRVRKLSIVVPSNPSSEEVDRRIHWGFLESPV